MTGATCFMAKNIDFTFDSEDGFFKRKDEIIAVK
jgi:hypothetical protein